MEAASPPASPRGARAAPPADAGCEAAPDAAAGASPGGASPAERRGSAATSPAEPDGGARGDSQYWHVALRGRVAHGAAVWLDFASTLTRRLPSCAPFCLLRRRASVASLTSLGVRGLPPPQDAALALEALARARTPGAVAASAFVALTLVRYRLRPGARGAGGGADPGAAAGAQRRARQAAGASLSRCVVCALAFGSPFSVLSSRRRSESARRCVRTWRRCRASWRRRSARLTRRRHSQQRRRLGPLRCVGRSTALLQQRRAQRQRTQRWRRCRRRRVTRTARSTA